MRSLTTFFLAIFSVKNFVFFILFRDPAEGSPIMATRGLSDQIWVVTVPNGQEADQTTLASLAKGTQDRGLCRLHKFEVPSLHHGTLDSLIALSDDLGKMNQQVEVSRQWRFLPRPRVFARHLCAYCSIYFERAWFVAAGRDALASSHVPRDSGRD